MSDSNEIYDIQSGGQATALKFTSFENAKTQLRTFSTRNSGDFGIDKVETDGGFLWLGDHKVTGTELNKVTSQVQDYLIKINDFSKDVVKEITVEISYKLGNKEKNVKISTYIAKE